MRKSKIYRHIAVVMLVILLITAVISIPTSIADNIATADGQYDIEQIVLVDCNDEACQDENCQECSYDDCVDCLYSECEDCILSECSDSNCAECENTAVCSDASCIDCFENYANEPTEIQNLLSYSDEFLSTEEIMLLGYNDAVCTADGCVNGQIYTENISTCETCDGNATITTTSTGTCSVCSGNGYNTYYTTCKDDDGDTCPVYLFKPCTFCGGYYTSGYTTTSSLYGMTLYGNVTIDGITYYEGKKYIGLGENKSSTGQAYAYDNATGAYSRSVSAGLVVSGTGLITTVTSSDCTDCIDGTVYEYTTSDCIVCDGDGLVDTAEIYLYNLTNTSQTILDTETASIAVNGVVNFTTEDIALNYQWYMNGGEILGATSSTYTASNLSDGIYYFQVFVSGDGVASVESDIFTVTVEKSIISLDLTQDIQNVVIDEGESTTLSVGAELLYSDGSTSSDGITYQWYQNNIAISGAINSYLTVGSGLSSGTYDYYCIMSYEGMDSVYSSKSVITVEAVPTSIWIEEDIISTSAIEGNNAILSIDAIVMYSDGSTSSEEITYQWYMDGVQISGATSDTLSIGSNLNVGSYLLYVQATCEDYSVRSSVIELEIISRKYIEITYAFTDSSFLEYITTNLYVVANVKDTLGNSYEGITYQWYIDGEKIEGENSGVYSFKGELQTIVNDDSDEEKVNPSIYLVQVKLSCDGCEDVWSSATITVEANDGTLTVCNTCYGATVITCPNCSGSGVEECAYCSSTGVVYVGYANYYNQTCSVCEDGYVDCYYCEGGLMDCPDCGGDYTPSAVGYTNTVQEDEDAWYTEAIKKLFLSVTIYMAGIIDLLINLFKKLVGLEEVSIGDSSSNILLYFLELEAVNNVLMYVIVIAFIMLFLFTGIQLIRAMKISDEKVNASKTFEGFLLAAGNILIVPMLLVVLIFSANVIMGQINTVFESGLVYSQADYDENSEISYGGQMLLLLTETEYDKAKVLDMTVDGQHWSDVAELLYLVDEDTKDEFFPNGQISSSATFGENSIIFTNGESFPNYAYMDIDNWTESGSSFWSTSSIDYGIYYIPTSRLQVFIAFAGCIAMLFALIMCSFTFVKRIFDVMLLYIVSPLMISTMPLDDGTRFKQWRDMLISKVLAAYAIVLTVNLYFMIVPTIIINPGVIFDEESAIANGIIQLIFVVGGAFALHSSNAVFGQLLGTGNMEQQQNIGTQMMMMNMVRLGAGVGIGTVAIAGKTVFSGAKHSVGTATGGISGLLRVVQMVLVE